MSNEHHDLISHMNDKAALPRKNGELVFEHPWQARVFAIAVRLSEQGLYEWDEFRQQLIYHIQLTDKERYPDEAEDPCKYYENWLTSLKKLLKEKLFISDEEIEKRLGLITLEAEKDAH